MGTGVVRARALAVLAVLAVLALPGGIATASQGSLAFSAAPDSGLDLVMTSGEMPSREILEVDGGGVALLDYDRDGDLDVFLANGATLDSPDKGPGSRLYANRGDGTFDDVTGRVGLELERWAMGATVGDYDGDGWDDLYVTCWGANALLRNESDGRGGRRFVDVAAAAHVADERWSTSAAFADLDGDGDLDLYVANYLDFDPDRRPERAGKAYRGVPVMAGPRGLAPQADALYENLGDGRFREVTAQAGVRIAGGPGYALSVRIADFDGDGRPDVFVGNDSTPDSLLHNRGDLRFEEVAAVAGVAADGSGNPQATMGVGLGDLDANGLPDLFVTVFSDDTNTLHLNLGSGLFEDRTAQFGLAAVSRRYLGWGCGFYDFDLDGDEDLFVANGHVYPEMDDPQVGAEWAQPVLLFERGERRFERAPCTASWCERRYHGRAVAFGDVDGDLDVDVLMTTLNGPVELLVNEAGEESGALAVLLRDSVPGSTVELDGPSGPRKRWLSGGGSYQSTDAPLAYFGLGPAAHAGALRIRWADGGATEIARAPRDRLLVVPRRAGAEPDRATR